jgi:hypothetical protein
MKHNKEDEEVESIPEGATTKKVSQPFRTFCEADAILVFDHFHWVNSPGRRLPFIHRALMRIKVTVTDSGDVKLGTRKPDVQEFGATLRRFGLYSSELEALNLAARDTVRANSA